MFGFGNLEAVASLLICQQVEKWTVGAKITGVNLNSYDELQQI